MIKTDVVIIGAGPCGLFQVFELGLLGLKCEVIDSIRNPGGQCAELYPDKPIYDIPAIQICTGQELTDALLQQIEPFEYGMTLNDEVVIIERQSANNFFLETSSGKKFQSKAIVIAGGVGSFQPRQLRVNNVEQFLDTSLHYRVQDSSVFRDKRLVVLGGGDSALDWVLDLVKITREMTLIHRRDEFRAVSASVSKVRKLHAKGKINLIESAKVSELIGKGGQLNFIKVVTKDGLESKIEIDNMLIFFGLAPKLGPIADWGLDINRKTINVDTEKFQTSETGIFAVGDINFYPGKKKLILSGFHEAALAAFAIKQQLEPNKKVHLQYTTTSSVMHERLGVKD
ncbi:MAG: NAD(P)/FAD-dependent oxidoreductase [Woeseiaceae bacterium]|nr:NAD(P)/FAD-dependent oxidoreductase [Woeseiaceae bacterium]